MSGSVRRGQASGIRRPQTRGPQAAQRSSGMAAVDDFTAGGYRFIPGGFQFSGGVAAAAGFEIKRCRFRAPVPLMEGFARIEAVIRAAGRPLTAFCACELRSPGQFNEQGFRAFNESYVVTLG